MIYLLDTNAFSDLMREHPQIDVHLAATAPIDRVIICSIVRGEILYGIERLPQGKKRRELEAKAANLFANLICEVIPEGAGDHYARVKLSREQKGLALDENDLWIASTALALSAVLVSRDRDFQQIDDLVVENWTI